MKTKRQLLFDLLTCGILYSLDTLRGNNEFKDYSDRDLEEEILHVIKSHKLKLHLIHPAQCVSCQFSFENRTKLSIPSRCPRFAKRRG